MNYLFSDFYLLVSAADKTCRRVGDAHRRMAELMGIPVSAPCLSHALRGLLAGGYLTVSSDSMITADTPLSITDAGKDAAVVSGLQKLMGEAKALNKKELRFCSLERPVTENGWSVDEASFSAAAEELLRSRSLPYPLFDLVDEGDGQLTLTLHHPSQDFTPTPSEEEEDTADAPVYGIAEDPDEAPRKDSVSVTGAADRILQSLSHLLETADDLLSSPRTHKVALHGVHASYIVTLAHAASEYGTTLRMTVAQIRFNRQRFYGKRDSELDYAQCGAPLITWEMGGAKELAARVLPCAVSLPKALGETEYRIIGDIHRKLKA